MSTGTWNCREGEFKCFRGYPACVTSTRICDGIKQCADGSDESQCGLLEDLSVTHTYVSKQLFSNIGHCGGIYTHPYGLLSSPLYPDQYPKNLNCTYIISQDKDTFIQLEARSFMTYFAINVHHGSCKDDFLEIRDGSSEQSPVVGKFCGTNIPASLESTQNIMWIR